MNKKKVKKSIVIYLISFFIIIGGMFYIRCSVEVNNGEEMLINITDGVSDNRDIIWVSNYADPWRETTEDGKYIISTQYDCTLYNKSNVALYDWTIEIQLPQYGRMQDWWNCNIETTNDKAILKPLDYNVEIGEYSEITIGFIMASEEVMTKPNMVIHGYLNKSVRDMREYWILLMILFIWAVVVFVNLLVAFFSKRYKRQIEENIEREIAREATYIARGTQKMISHSVLVDLEKENYCYLEKWSEVDKIPIKGTYKEYVDYQVSIQVTDEEKKEVANTLDKTNLLKAFGSDKEEITFVSHYKENTDIWKMTYVVAMERKEDAVSKVLFVDMDITEAIEERKKVEKILEDALYMAQCANKAKTLFLSNVSHDIRTPMNAIIGFTNLASANIGDKEKVEGYLKKIETSSGHLLSLINNVLDMSRIESGKIEIEEAIWNLDDIALEIRDLFQAQAKEKNIEFVVDTQIRQKIVFCDKLRMNQVIVNLVSNAIKYTQKGGKVKFIIKQSKCGNKEYEKYMFIVQDNGYGMSKEFASHVFEPFEREVKNTTSNIQGTGLGLAITKNIVDMLGGVIELETKENEGSTFTVYLDLRAVDTGETVEKDTDETLVNDMSGFELTGKRALLVDDNEINVEIAVEILKITGMDLEVAVNGKEAVDMFNASEEGYYDMILMDIQMPVMNGLEATREIRKLPRADVNLPIVALSANAFEEDVRKSMASGMDGHISKPIIIENLFEVLKEVVAKKQKM